MICFRLSLIILVFFKSCDFVSGQFHIAVYSTGHHIEVHLNTEKNEEFTFKVKYRNKPVIQSSRLGFTLNKPTLKWRWLCNKY
jgi:hypothetical protein